MGANPIAAAAASAPGSQAAGMTIRDDAGMRAMKARRSRNHP
jgi:hypothetical protein